MMREEERKENRSPLIDTNSEEERKRERVGVRTPPLD